MNVSLLGARMTENTSSLNRNVTTQHGCNDDLYQGSPQYIQMFPKRHLTNLSVICRLSHIVI